MGRNCVEVRNVVQSYSVNNGSYKAQGKNSFKFLSDDCSKKDVVDISQKKDKKLNKNVIVTSGLAIVGTALCAATKGRLNIFKHAVKSAEFINAKSVKEAVTYGKKNLKIQRYENYDLANLDMINTLNEMLHKEKSLTGEIPQVIRFLKRGELPVTAPMGYKLEPEINKRVLFVNTDTFNRFDEVIKDAFVERGKGTGLSNFISISNGKYVLSDLSYKSNTMDKFIEKLNAFNPNSSFKDKMELYQGIANAKSFANAGKIGLKDCKMQDFAYDDIFVHEMGHMHHQLIYPKYQEAGSQMSQIRIDFASDTAKLQIPYRVSSYAASSPLEFVAEVYTGLRKGQHFDNEVMSLYRRYNGPIVN